MFFNSAAHRPSGLGPCIFGSLIAIGLSLFACGKTPEAQRQNVSNRALPEWPADSTGGMKLAGDSTVQSYQGSVVMWAPAATAAGIAEVASASSNNRTKRAAIAKFQREEIAPREATRVRVIAEIARERQAASAAASDHQRTLAADWFEGQLSGLVAEGRISEADVEHARGVFTAYCEAKIWEAVSSRIGADYKKSTTFADRPSPAWFCEGVYRQRGLLQGEAYPECGAAAAGTTYEQCLWQRGFLQTSQYQGRYEGGFALRPDLKKSAKFTEWIQDGTLRFHFMEAESPAKVRNGFMLNKKIRPGSALNFGAVDNREFGDVFVPAVGEPLDRADARLDQMSPDYLINQVEDLSLPPAAGGAMAIAPAALLLPGAATNSEIAEVVQGLRRTISALHRREAGAASLGDVVLGTSQDTLAEPSDLAGKRSTPGLADLLNAIDRDAQARIDALVAEEARLTAAIEGARARAVPLDEAWTAAMNRGALAATADGVSEAFFPTTKLILKHHGTAGGDGFAEVRLTLDKNAGVLSGCFSLGDGAKLECPPQVADELGASRIPAEVTIDLVKSKIEVKAAVGDGVAMGLVGRPAATDQAVRATGFNAMGDIAGADQTFSAELYGNTLEGMPFFTGKIFLRDGAGTIRHEGATSLMPYN